MMIYFIFLDKHLGFFSFFWMLDMLMLEVFCSANLLE